MRWIVLSCLLLCANLAFGQSDALAKNYFQQGSYQKALSVYTKLLEKNPGRNDYLSFAIKCNQELERYAEAEILIRQKLDRKRPLPQYYVELGHNYALQNQDSLAGIEYKKAIEAINTEPIFAYGVGKAFSNYSLLTEAAQVYERAMELDPERDFNPQLARIYGEQGELELMFEKYVEIIQTNVAYRPSAQRSFSYYIEEDPENEANKILKKVLLKRLQKDPDILYNELLSWLYIQQNQFDRAFVQEKAIFRRSEGDLTSMVDLLRTSMEADDFEAANEIVEFLLDNAPSPEAKLRAHQFEMNIALELATPGDYPDVEKRYRELFDTYGYGTITYYLQIDYNHFLAFDMKQLDTAIENLKTLTKKELTVFQEARVKMELADILVMDEKFNEALIYYSQIQTKVKSDVLAQEARFKVARTSYFKGDFLWAQTQLDVLRRSSSQLIANDAMELNLMIRDNSLEDTTQIALKKYAKADLRTFQNRLPEAVSILEDLLLNHKGESIEDEALLKMGEIQEALGNYEAAVAHYEKLLQFYSDDITADDAYYRLGILYETYLGDPDKAREYYEMILFNHADSIYFVDARKRFRMLRGDTINP